MGQPGREIAQDQLIPANGATATERLAALQDELLGMIGRIDHVTHLPNRLQFIEHFSALMRPDRRQMVLLVTLAEARHYNEILRALGMAFAEDFVRAGARLLRSILPAEQSIYHVSVLSFAVVIEVEHDQQMPAIATPIAAAFAGAIGVNAIPIKTHVGVGLMPCQGCDDASEVLRAALVAAQDSRQSDLGIGFYNHKTDAAHLRAFRILADLPIALATPGQLSLHYQPRIQLASGRCHGAEALLRWNHPELGAISPAEFVPLAEQTALISPLTEWVIDTALSQNRAFLDDGHNLRISINASPVNLSEIGFDDSLLARCDAAGLAPSNVELEFTEGALATNSARTIAHLARIRSAGIDVALDDFGSGYSNLSYLSRIPADVLKIDQSFVRPLKDAKDDDFLVRHIISMANGLGFRVCAEGIETQHAYERLRELGAEEGQGYHMARPMAPALFTQWLAAQPR